jgi:hypothetical protein
MADEHLEELRKAGSVLVAARRGQVRTILNPTATTGLDARTFADFQEAIDRAIEDERKLKGEGK